jgi:hypothetical protein
MAYKIKNIKDNSGSGDGATITITDANPPKGTTPPDIDFDQPNFKALCFNIGDYVNVDFLPGTTTVVGARRISRGTVLTVDNTNNSGTISENKTSKSIAFYQPLLKELGIGATVEVKYDLIINLKAGGEIAVNVQILQ